MNWLKSFVVAFLICLIRGVSANEYCATYERILKAGYEGEKYDVVTEDGYILEMLRIPRGRNQTVTSQSPLVFLMHGLGESASDFLNLSPEYAMAFDLADSGFDVWLGNGRGSCHSRRHQSLDPDDKIDKFTFFDFSWDEIGIYDLPAMINFALQKSGQDRLHYIGHSQGGTTFLVLNSMRPQYNAKFITAHLLAGIGYQKYFPKKMFIREAVSTNAIYEKTKAAGNVEIIQPDFSFNTNNTLDTMNETERANISVKQLAHYGQNVKDKQFRRWSYSTLQNIAVYGSYAPPNYDLSKINVDTTMHYSLGDKLQDERDVLAMVRDLPNARARQVANKNFSHSDFIKSPSAKPLVIDFIIDDIRRR